MWDVCRLLGWTLAGATGKSFSGTARPNATAFAGTYRPGDTLTSSYTAIDGPFLPITQPFWCIQKPPPLNPCLPPHQQLNPVYCVLQTHFRPKYYVHRNTEPEVKTPG
jgi:hypothetical protein